MIKYLLIGLLASATGHPTIALWSYGFLGIEMAIILVKAGIKAGEKKR